MLPTGLVTEAEAKARFWRCALAIVAGCWPTYRYECGYRNVDRDFFTIVAVSIRLLFGANLTVILTTTSIS
jgi:hypothetical protein